MSLRLPTFVRPRPYSGIAFRSSFFVDEKFNLWFTSLNRKINYIVNSTYKLEYDYIKMIFIKYILYID